MDDHLATMVLGLHDGPANALAGAAAGLLIVDADGGVIFANPAAHRLFAPLQPLELRVPALLGLSGASGGGALALALQAGGCEAPVRIGLRDGRVLDAQVSRSANHCMVITLFDVSCYIREAELAPRDALTGLANRKMFQERLSALLVQSERTAVLSLDLNRFKAVDDNFGHPTGDALLVQVSERLRNIVRAGDMVARLGGHEFAVLQADAAQPEAAEALAGRLVDLIGRTYLVAEHVLNIGVSIGVAIAPSDGRDAATLMKRADLALYRAKSEGGNGGFRFFQAAMDAEMQARRALELDLRRALALKEFEVAYQPQVDLISNQVVGFEALLRWRHPERGLVPPSTFIPLAEEIGLICAIGEWVLRSACRAAAAWEQPLTVAVNLSALQFNSSRLVETVLSSLAASGLAATRLELEITEGALLASTDSVLQQLHALKTLGVKISMDDFGTGYSSLSYLQKFPFDKIKIDQSFVRGSDASTECEAIVRAVAALGASLGIKTTAEGVETGEQLDRIRAQGCTQVQGYLTGRPLTEAAASQLASRSPNDKGKNP